MRWSWRKLLIYLVGIIMVGGAVWLGIRLAFPRQPVRITVQPSSQGLISRLLGRTHTPAESTSYELDKETGIIRVIRTDSSGQQHKYEGWVTENGWVWQEMTEE